MRYINGCVFSQGSDLQQQIRMAVRQEPLQTNFPNGSFEKIICEQLTITVQPRYIACVFDSKKRIAEACQSVYGHVHTP